MPITLTEAETPLAVAARSRGEPGCTACGRIELEIGGSRLGMTGPVDPVVVTALVAALRAS